MGARWHMDVIVDGERNLPDKALPADAMEALACISDSLKARGRAVMAVCVNGKNLNADELADVLKNQPLETLASFEVRSESIRELVGGALSELDSVLPELPAACHALASVFQGNNPTEGYAPFQELADIWRHIKDRQQLAARSLDVNIESLRIGDATYEELQQQLNVFLQEAVDALRVNDCVLLGDLLEYELAPRAEKELLVVAALRKQLDELPV